MAISEGWNIQPEPAPATIWSPMIRLRGKVALWRMSLPKPTTSRFMPTHISSRYFTCFVHCVAGHDARLSRFEWMATAVHHSALAMPLSRDWKCVGRWYLPLMKAYACQFGVLNHTGPITNPEVHGPIDQTHDIGPPFHELKWHLCLGAAALGTQIM